MQELKKPSKSDNFLKHVELISVSIVALSLWFAAIFSFVWILFGTGGDQQTRLARVIKGMNVNWKIGLLLLIPLFYRTVREILERMEEGPLGTKFPNPKVPKTDTPDSEEETRPTIGQEK
ncbi:MAG: hypothetical protein JOY62_04975 [Acidobacteriaceae bacterium]|nr:hypothetical protein [Acidobacteriaceae bacterium]